jgi:polyisoprenoid-binding protein YceI
MNVRSWLGAAALFVSGAVSPLRSAPQKSGSQQHTIDTRTSVMTVHVYKAGLLSAFGHDHEIAAPIASGSVDTGTHQTELRLDAGALRVRDLNVSEKDRSEIQKTMLGPEVLDVVHHREIVFRSTAVEPAGGSGSWKVHGTLTLHGQTRPVTVEVTEKAGRYAGHAAVKQTDFGIQPIRIAGGTVRVKDEVRIEFDIQLAH